MPTNVAWYKTRLFVALDHSLRFSERDDPFTWPEANEIAVARHQFGRIRAIEAAGESLLIRMDRGTLQLEGEVPCNFKVTVTA